VCGVPRFEATSLGDLRILGTEPDLDGFQVAIARALESKVEACWRAARVSRNSVVPFEDR